MPTEVAVLDDITVEEFPRECTPTTEVSPDEATAAPSSTLFYGWLMLPMAMLLMIATSPGQTFGLAFFNEKFRAAFDLSQTRLSVTYLLATVAASFAIPTIGGWVDRFGLKRSALVAVTTMAAACVFASQVQGVVTLFFAFMILRTVGPGSMTLLANNTLASWFNRRLGLASGIMQVGMAGALAVVPAGILVLIESFGWRGAFLAIGAIVACTLMPLLLFFYRESPRELGLLPDGEPMPTGGAMDSSVGARCRLGHECQRSEAASGVLDPACSGGCLGIDWYGVGVSSQCDFSESGHELGGLGTSDDLFGDWHGNHANPRRPDGR